MAAVAVGTQVLQQALPQVTIKPPAFKTAEFVIIGTAPYCQNRFSRKSQQQMEDKQKAGQQGSKGKAKTAKDFEECFRQAQYKSKDGWNGIPASCFRNAMISACRIVGFKMTHAKLGVFIEADGLDAEEGTPLVRLDAKPPVMRIHHVRNATGVPDLRPRPFWDTWQATLRVTFDGDMFTVSDVANLLARVGQQVGIGDGRPDSKDSAGMGWGLFRLQNEDERVAKKSRKH